MPLHPSHLRCEHRLDPLGIDSPSPRLSWQSSAEGTNQVQSAWQVRAAATAADLVQGRNLLWDSGRVTSDASLDVVYGGAPLRSRAAMLWQVRLWDGAGVEGPWSTPARFELGLLQASDWQATWIRSTEVGSPWAMARVPFLRKAFVLAAAPLRARLYVTALGLHECHLNGQRVSEDRFAPGWTDYRQRVQYQVYDVTGLLQEGENVLGALLGDGWYCGHINNQERQNYGDRPQLLAQLEVETADGQHHCVRSDGTWKTSAGPIIESDMQMGEQVDARHDLGAWSQPGYDDRTWQPVIPGVPVTAALVAMKGPPVRATQELPAKAITPPLVWSHRAFLFDFGQNLVGHVRVRVQAPAGTKLRFRYSEILDKEQRPYYENLRQARATDSYVCRGGGVEVFEPHFTFHGFRYLEITAVWNTQITITAEDVTAVVVHSAMGRTGEFECSHALLNQLHRNIDWGLRGNFLDIPTDCPQRDERLGWTGDAQVFIRTACGLRDVQGFFDRWMQDFIDAQRTNGAMPVVVPDNEMNPTTEGDAGPAWGDAAVICPWAIYRHYGDLGLLRRQYPSMVRYLGFVESKARNLIRYPDCDSWGGFGDWLSLDAPGNNPDGGTRKDLIGTAYFAHDADLLACAATALGFDDDARRHRALHARVVEAFQRRFTSADGLLVGGNQTAYVLALGFALLPPAVRPTAAAELAESVRRRGMHLATGFVGTPMLCQVLAEHGHLDVAYGLLEQTTYPSWLFPVTLGATTIWERWDGWHPERGFQDKAMNSFNHYAYGAIGAWMHAAVAGLDLDPTVPAYKRICFRPRPGGSLTHARYRLHTPYGWAGIQWHKEPDGCLRLELEVPANTQATLDLGKDYEATYPTALGSGQHRLSVRAGSPRP